MNENFFTDDFENSEEVSKHLRQADYLLIFLPMVLSAVFLIVVPIIWTVIDHLGGNPTMVGGFDFSGLVIFAGIFFWLIFCGFYGLMAYIFSVSTMQNSTFRIRLATVLFSAVILFLILLYQV